MMVLGVLMLVSGLVASYFALQLAFKDSEIKTTKFATLLIGVYFSLTIISGLFMNVLGIPISINSYLLTFLLLIVLGFQQNKKEKTNLKLADDRTFLFGYLLLLIAGFYYYIQPALPTLYPLGMMEDAPRHFVLSQYIQEAMKLPNGEFYGFTNIMTVYPFGWHLNVALLSTILSIPLIQITYPFIAFITALTAAVIFGIVWEIIKENKMTALVSGFFILTSSYVLFHLTLQSSWPILFGAFLATVFTWILIDYTRKPSTSLLGLLTLIASATILTYVSWGIIILFGFLITAHFQIPLLIRKRHIGYFIGSTTLLTGIYWLGKFGQIQSRTSDLGAFITKPIEAFGIMFTIMAIIGIAVSAKRKERIPLYFLISVIAQPLLLFLYSSFTGATVESYWYYKTYYFVAYPLAIFTALAAKELYRRWDSLYQRASGEKTKAYFLLIIIMLSLYFGALFQINNSKEFRGKNLSITPAKYHAAIQIEKIVPPDQEIVHIIDGQLSYSWFNSITHRQEPYTIFTTPLTRSQSGDHFLIHNIEQIPPEELRQFETLYINEEVALIKK